MFKFLIVGFGNMGKIHLDSLLRSKNTELYGVVDHKINKKNEEVNYFKSIYDVNLNDDIDAVIKALKSDFLTQGPTVTAFEEAFAKEMGSRYAVAVSSATAALHLSCLALNLSKNQKVITSPLTFVASANCVLYCNGLVDFCDIDPLTYTMDLDKLQEKLEKSPKGTFSGIIPVSYAGHPIDSEKLNKLALEYNLWVIEDNCHAPGSFFRDSLGKVNETGNSRYSDLSTFSLHPVKRGAKADSSLAVGPFQDFPKTSMAV